MIQVDEETWLRLCKFKKFPERSSFRDVINWLVDEVEKNGS